MSGLPRGWTSTTLESLVGFDGLFSDGDWVESKDQDPSGAIRLLQLADVGDGKFLNKSRRFLNDEQFKRLRCTEVLAGDVLIARMPDPLGRACIVPSLNQRCVTVVDVAIVRPDTASANPRWLMHFLNSQWIRQTIESEASGTTRRRISRGKLAKLQLPLPPLPEQKRIADKLDALLARVDACRERLDRVPAILKRFRQSVLAAATSGELTRDWRESSDLDWQQVTVSDVAAQLFDGPFGSHLKSSDYVEHGVRVVRLENIASLRFINEKQTFVSHEKYESLRRHTLRTGDIIFSSFVDEDVRVCLLPDHLDNKAINKADCFCIRVRPADCRPRFLALRLACRSTFRALDEVVHGATRPRINLTQLKGIELGLPSIDEQDEIISRCDALFEIADALERKLAVIQEETARIAPATLAKAFRGELVPQDPNDEPAAALLARIAATRQNHAAAPRAGRLKGAKGKPKRNPAGGAQTVPEEA